MASGLVDFVVMFIIFDYDSFGFFIYREDENKMLVNELSLNAVMVPSNSCNDKDR